MNIPIIYEDDDLLVIDKPAGTTVNRAETTKDKMTIQDWAEARGITGTTGSTSTTSNENENNSSRDTRGTLDTRDTFYDRGGVAHRLDKETSGVLILAKNPESFIELQRQFKEREVKKVYLALAHGKISPPEGEINVPVGRLPWSRNRFGIIPGGRKSETKYKVLKEYYDYKNKERLSLVELYPQSGRTHQIRVHLKYINHPIFSDFLYAGRKTARKDRRILSRVFLHAAKISFSHPKKYQLVSFESPLPQDLKNLLETLQEVV